MKNRFCSNCGKQIADGAAFCGGCGTSTAPQRAQPTQPSGGKSSLIGFSPKINDKAFASHKKKSAITMFAFAGIVTVVAFIAIPIYADSTGKMTLPNSFLTALLMSGLFWGISLIITLKKSLDKTWDGVVESKNTGVERTRNAGYKTYERGYVMRVRKNSGGSKTHRWKTFPGLYNYYNIGDKVRHHKGFSYYEKYDKSGDTHIMCAACMKFNDIKLEKCARCKCPLLKNSGTVKLK